MCKPYRYANFSFSVFNYFIGKFKEFCRSFLKSFNLTSINFHSQSKQFVNKFLYLRMSWAANGPQPMQESAQVSTLTTNISSRAPSCCKDPVSFLIFHWWKLILFFSVWFQFKIKLVDFLERRFNGLELHVTLFKISNTEFEKDQYNWKVITRLVPHMPSGTWTEIFFLEN